MDQPTTAPNTLVLSKYRDSYCHSFDWYWVDKETCRVVSPYFPSEQEARDWLTKNSP